jgi:hypothetical protein
MRLWRLVQFFDSIKGVSSFILHKLEHLNVIEIITNMIIFFAIVVLICFLICLFCFSIVLFCVLIQK